jgi:hypothetical protein
MGKPVNPNKDYALNDDNKQEHPELNKRLKNGIFWCGSREYIVKVF